MGRFVRVAQLVLVGVHVHSAVILNVIGRVLLYLCCGWFFVFLVGRAGVMRCVGLQVGVF